jgi:hypothetical protein
MYLSSNEPSDEILMSGQLAIANTGNLNANLPSFWWNGGLSPITHYQEGNNKYLYDPASKSFPNAPNSVNKMLENPEFRRAIEKGMKQYLGE